MEQLIANIISEIRGGASVVEIQDDKYSSLVEVTYEEGQSFNLIKLGYVDVYNLDGELLQDKTFELIEELNKWIESYNKEQRVKMAEWAEQKKYEQLGGIYAYK